MAAGVMVTSLLLVLLSLLCCCCLCGQQDSADPEKKAKRQLCGGFTRISSKLPRIPLRRQKLPRVVVSHHDPENTLSCSFMEPPSGAEEPSPSWSSRGSLSSLEGQNDAHACSAPHHDSGEENKMREDRNNTETTVLVDDDDDGDDDDDDDDSISEVETLPEDSKTAEQASVHSSDPPRQTSSESGSEAATVALKGPAPPPPEALKSPAPHPPEALKGPAPPPPQQIHKHREKKGGSNKEKENRKCALDRMKPRPPDPSTKPKVSWIHRATGSHKDPLGQEATGLDEQESSGRRASNNRPVRPGEGTGVEEASSLGERPAQRSSSGLVPLDHFNGAVQSVLRKMSSFRVNKKAETPTESPPKSPGSSSNKEVIQPNMNSEAASLLAAQLKEKTQSLSRSEGKTSEEGSLSQVQGQRKKPTPPQKTSTGGQHGAGRALLPTSSSQRPGSETSPKEAKTLEKQDSEKPEKEDNTVKKTPMKKPPRNRGKDRNSDLKTKTEQKVAVMPPQAVN